MINKVINYVRWLWFERPGKNLQAICYENVFNKVYVCVSAPVAHTPDIFPIPR